MTELYDKMTFSFLLLLETFNLLWKIMNFCRTQKTNNL